MVLQKARSIQGFRFVVKGVRPHKKTGMFWLRLRTPERLIKKRVALEALGVDFRVEIHRSLGTKDKSEAAMAYSAKRAEIERIWETWDRVLESGPDKLSERNRMALAGELAKRFFSENEEDPHEVSAKTLLPWHEQLVIAVLEEALGKEITVSEATQMLSADALPLFSEQEALDIIPFAPGERDQFRELYGAWQKADGRAAKSEAVLRLLFSIRSFQVEFRPVLARFLTKEFGAVVDGLLDEKGLFVSAEDRVMLLLDSMLTMETAKVGIENRRMGDWGPVAALDRLPDYRAGIPTKKPYSKVAGTETISEALNRAVTFEEIIGAERALSDLGLRKHLKSSRTFDKYLQDTRRFVEWRGSDNILSITRSEVGRWRDQMTESVTSGEAKFGERTIVLRVTAVQAVLTWAIWHADQMMDGIEEKNRPAWHRWVREAFKGKNPLSGIDLPVTNRPTTGARTHSRELARELLAKCRAETDPAKRWFSWLLAYTGAREHEIAKLEKGDIKSYEGIWYIEIRGTWSRKNRPRRIPIHRALIAEGFIEFALNAPDGALFPGKWVVKKLRDYQHSIVDFKGRPPFHGFRHLFRDLATTKMELAAAYYIEGRVLPGSGKDYGGSRELLRGLAEQINKIEPLLPLPNEEPNGIVPTA